MMEDELTDYLAALGRDEAFRVERVLKSAPAECTEVVYFRGFNGAEMGPFIRKRLDRGSQLGNVYERLFEAQRAGRRFLHLPRLSDVYRTERELVIVSEYVLGRPLSEVVGGEGPSARLAARVFPPLCDAVAELHESFDPPVIHRDLTPANIIVTDAAAQVTLIDFGISRVFRAEAPCDTTHYGTRPYAPPEQFGFGQTDVRSDLYSLGAVLRFCVTGRAERDAVPPAVPPASILAVIERACALDPSGRYKTARDLRAAFQVAIDAPEQPIAPRADPLQIASLGGVSSDHAVDTSMHGAFTVVGRIWNTAIAVLVALVAIAMVSLLDDPSWTQGGDPVWYRALIGFTFILPNLCSIGYLLLDRRRLRGRYAFFARRSWPRDLRACGIVFAVTLIVNVIAAAFLKA